MSVVYAPASLKKGYRATFLTEMAKPGRELPGRIATVVQSDSDKENFAWLGEPTQMAEFKTELEFTPLSDTEYEITNKTFAAGVKVKRVDESDDKIGAIAMRFRQLAQVAKKHRNKLLVDTLVSGTTDTCYDGAAFFSDTHASRGAGTGSGTQDNLLAGTGTTTAAVATDLNTAISTLAGFKAENGEPFHEELGRLAIVFPPGMRKSIREAINASMISSTSNVQFQGDDFDLIMESRLTDANDIYVLHVGGSVMPLLFQDREPLEYSTLEGDDTETGFLREVNLHKVRARYNAGYAHWQNAIKIVNS